MRKMPSPFRLLSFRLLVVCSLSASCGGAVLAQTAPATTETTRETLEGGFRRTTSTPAGVHRIRDVRYATAGGVPLHVDIYLPEAHAKKIGNTPGQEVKSETDLPRLPVVVWLHGGAWRVGSKDFCPAARFATRGYAVVSVQYRFSQQAVFPAQIHDCKGAIRWIRANAGVYGFDPDRIGVWGVSAGAHLALLLGVTDGSAPHEGDVGGNLEHSSRVAAVLNWFGPTDLRAINVIGRDNAGNAVAKLLGGSGEKTAALAELASPLLFVGPGDAPLMTKHGDLDVLVPIAQSEQLHEAYRQAGLEERLVVIKGGGHGFPPHPDEAKMTPETHLGAALVFFDKHLKAVASAQAPKPAAEGDMNSVAPTGSP